MCGMCPDVFDGCNQIECGARSPIDENGNRRSRYMRWFTYDDKLCKHLAEEYGSDNPSLIDHVQHTHFWEDEDWALEKGPLYCEDNCSEWGYSEEDIMKVTNKLREREKQWQ